MSRKKITALLCSLTLVLGSAGCGGAASQTPAAPAETAGTQEASPASQAPASEAAVTPEAPAEAEAPAAEAAPAGERETITILTQTYSDAPAEGNRYVAEIEELTNTNLEMTFAPAQSYTEKFVMTIASGEMPMLLLVTEDKHASYVDAIDHGAFWELNPYLSEYPTLSSLGDSMWENAKYNGANYMVPRYRPIARNGMLYRKDWADAAGIAEPTNMDELYEMIKAFGTGDFDGNGQVDSFGWAVDSIVSINYITSLFGASTTWGLDDDGTVHPSFAEQEYLDAITWLRRLYSENLMNVDFTMLQNSKQLFAQGNVGVWGDICDDIRTTEIITDLPANAPGAEVGVLYQLSGPKGVRSSATSAGYYGGFAIPKSAVADEAALKRVLGFLEIMAGPEIANLLTYGQEGTDYTLDGDTVIQTDEQKAEYTIVRSGLDQIIVSNYDSLYQPSSPLDVLVYEMWDTLEQNVVINPVAAFTSPTYSSTTSELGTIRSDAVTKYIMGTIDEAGFRAEVDRWYASGGEQVCAEFTEAYNQAQ